MDRLDQNKESALPCDSEAWKESLARQLKFTCIKQHRNLEALRIQNQIKAVSILHHQGKS